MAKLTPILFSTPMVQAILRGDKEITRRLSGLEKINEFPDGHTLMACCEIERDKYGPGLCFDFAWGDDEVVTVIPKWQPGDILWVRESWQYAPQERCSCPQGSEPSPCDAWLSRTGCESNRTGFIYKANFTEGEFEEASDEINDDTAYCTKWKPSIHMPKAAARIFLRVKSVRVERLQSISEADAKAEGMERMIYHMGTQRFEATDESHVFHSAATYKCGFEYLWSKINGIESWNANPFVWVVEFERLSDKEVKEMKAAEDWMKSCMDYAIEVHKTGPERKAKRIEEMSKAFIGDGIKLIEKPE